KAFCPFEDLPRGSCAPPCWGPSATGSAAAAVHKAYRSADAMDGRGDAGWSDEPERECDEVGRHHPSKEKRKGEPPEPQQRAHQIACAALPGFAKHGSPFRQRGKVSSAGAHFGEARRAGRLRSADAQTYERP